MGNKRAFTLVELLVVIAIIAVLMSILLPAIGGAKRQAAAVACASNLKQTGIAVYMYGQEYNNYIVPFEEKWTNDWGVAATRWNNYLEPYTKNYDVMNCPVMNKQRANSRSGSNTMARNVTIYNFTDDVGYTYSSLSRGRSAVGYTCNYAFQSYVSFIADTSKLPSYLGPPSMFCYQARNNTALQSLYDQTGRGPGNILLISDGVYQITTTSALSGSNSWYTTKAPWRYVHPGPTMNVLFLDGHVEPVTMMQLESKYWNYTTIIYTR